MWGAISKTRSSTINKKEVQILLKIVDDQKTIPKTKIKGKKRMHVPVVQLHTYTHDDRQQHKTYLIFYTTTATD